MCPLSLSARILVPSVVNGTSTRRPVRPATAMQGWVVSEPTANVHLAVQWQCASGPQSLGLLHRRTKMPFCAFPSCSASFEVQSLHTAHLQRKLSGLAAASSRMWRQCSNIIRFDLYGISSQLVLHIPRRALAVSIDSLRIRHVIFVLMIDTSVFLFASYPLKSSIGDISTLYAWRVRGIDRGLGTCNTTRNM